MRFFINKQIFFLLSLLCICLSLPGCKSSSGNKATIEYNGNKYSHGEKITVVGYITTVGSEPLTETVLVAGNNYQFVIPREHMNKLENSGYGTLQIEGVLHIKILETVRERKKIYIPQLIPIKVEPVQ